MSGFHKCDDVATGGSAGVADSGDSIYCVAAVPASGGAIPSQLLLGSKRGRLYLWDLRQSGVLWTVAQLQDKVLGCAASLCGRRVVAGSRAGQVCCSIDVQAAPRELCAIHVRLNYILYSCIQTLASSMHETKAVLKGGV